MLALLAPVPRIHLADAVEIANSAGNVAFGSGSATEESTGAWSFEFFSQPAIKREVGHLPVLIYPSRDVNDGRPLRAEYRGIYNGFDAALPNGKHRNPAERPKSALATDTRFAIFWKVTSLVELSHRSQIPLKKLQNVASWQSPLAVQ